MNRNVGGFAALGCFEELGQVCGDVICMKKDKIRKYRRGRKRGNPFQCHCCKKELPFCWNCPCGFQICDVCFKENMWGISNGPTWVCPDCGRIRMM